MTRILIVDDHAIVRHGIRQTLALCPTLQVCGEAENGWEAVEQVRHHAFDLVLLDMSMPGPSGVELIRRMRQEKPHLQILVLSMHDEGQFAAKALKAGASGYVTKGCEPETLLLAVKKVASGGRFIEPRMAEEMVLGFGLSGEKQPHEYLSKRESQVLLKLAAGRTINDIAEELALSAKTVSSHKAKLMQKLNVANRAQLIRYAMQNGLVD